MAMSASIVMGIVRLSASVAASEDVRKHPLGETERGVQ